jgi:glycosyltransferase involved in cell wall biosynthesis
MKLLLASFFPNKIFPVKGPFIKNFADNISATHAIAVLTVEADSQQQGFWYLEKVNQANYPVYTVYYNHQKVPLPLIRSIITFFSFFFGLHQALKQIELENGPIELVHLHSSLPLGIFAVWLKWTKGLSFLLSEQVTIYIYERFQKLGFFQKFIHKIIFNQAKRVSALTQYHANEITRCGLKREVSVIPNVIDTRHYKVEPKQASPVPKTVFHWVHMSTLSPVKGVEEMIKALAHVVELGYSIKFTIIGGDQARIQELDALAKSLNIQNHIVWLGWLTREEFVLIISQSDLFLLNSEFETFCVVAAESLACGIPVVAPNIPPLDEFIHDTNGTFFENRNYIEMSQAIIQCMEKLEIFDAELISQQIKHNFGKERVEQLFNDFYQIS